MGHDGETTTTASQTFEGIMSHIGRKMSVRTVYGEPTILGDHAVIPVAEVKYGGGGGWGGGHGPTAELPEGETAEEFQGEGEGMGMGFGVSARPIGALDITADGVHWAPVFEWGKIVQIWSLVTGFVVAVAAVKWLFSRD